MSAAALFATPTITREEVRALAAEGTEAARNKLVLANMRLVAQHARKYARLGVDIEDLIQHGAIGLLRASEKFDPDRGVAFSTYASFWIRQAIARVANEKTVTISHNVRGDVARVARIDRVMTSRLGRSPTVEELSAETGLDEARLENIRSARIAALAASLSSQVDDEHEVELGDTLPDPESLVFDIAEALDERSRARRLHTMMKGLPRRDREVLKLRFGFGEREPQTLEVIAVRLGLSRERVRQIEQASLERLRGALLRSADRCGRCDVAKSEIVPVTARLEKPRVEKAVLPGCCGELAETDRNQSCKRRGATSYCASPTVLVLVAAMTSKRHQKPSHASL
jgi:RNA polymerase sigma factor (sigma-70 family)